MPFFEGKEELYLILCLLIIPTAVCGMFYFMRIKQLWIAPIFIVGIFIIVSAIFYPYYFTDLINSDYDSTTIYWLIFLVPVQIVAASLFTAATCFLSRVKKEKKTSIACSEVITLKDILKNCMWSMLVLTNYQAIHIIILVTMWSLK
ncbi:MAG: hypothetical protein SCK29_13195 [Bacillota bacterium]|nr:hypothetical protein [Bacillota bacterium]